MISRLEIKSKLTVIDKMGEEACFEILQYDSVRGTLKLEDNINVSSVSGAMQRLKQVKITLEDSAVRIEKNSLCYMKGNVKEKSSIDEHKSLRKILFSNKPIIDNDKICLKGTGEIVLKPSFEYFTLVKLIDDEIIIKNDIFLACEDEIKITQCNNDELILKGNGIAVLKLKVPENEVVRCKIYKDKIISNGDISILRSKNISHTKEEESNLIDEDELNIYYGTGEVWLLPTQIVYNKDVNESYEELYEEDE